MITISITTGTDEGPTPLAAFDRALLDAGVANYNLIPLFSGIPPASWIQRVCYEPPTDEYGDRLYWVMARGHAQSLGGRKIASLGWVQEPVSMRCLFVEIEGSERQKVEKAIHATFASMVQVRLFRYERCKLNLLRSSAGATRSVHWQSRSLKARAGTEGGQP